MLGVGLRLLQALGQKQSRPMQPIMLTAVRAVASHPDSNVHKASVRLQDGGKVVLSLNVKGRIRNLTRDEQEPLCATLLRLKLLVKPLPYPQARSTTQAVKEDPPIAHFYKSTTPSIRQALEQARMLVLDNKQYILEHYPPEVTSMTVYGQLCVGLPYVVHAEVAYTHPDACEYIWRRSDKPVKARHGHVPGEPVQWVEVGRGKLYSPTKEDAGHALCVECTPMRRGQSWPQDPTSSNSSNPVASTTTEEEQVVGPATTMYLGTVYTPHGPWGFASRITQTPAPVTAPRLRVVSYNVLAENYSQTDVAKHMLFPDCPPWALKGRHRLPIILSELLGYHADILALQEVDATRFADHFYPMLKHHGYDGVFTPKESGIEGVALFWRASRYRMVAREDVSYCALIKQALENKTPPTCVAPLLPMIQACFKLQQLLQDIGQVAQMVCLVPVDHTTDQAPASQENTLDGPLCVVNTHLYFHRHAPHVRSIQAAVLAHETARFADSMMQRMADTSTPAVVLCGDLNSDHAQTPFPGCVELLRAGRLPETHFDWEVGAGFVFEQGSLGKVKEEAGDNTPGGKKQTAEQDQAVEVAKPTGPIGATLQMPLCLRSADDFSLPFTNYGALDYVWHEPMRMRCVRVLPTPLVNDTLPALPSPKWPSDHIAVVADLEWLAQDAQQTWRPDDWQPSGEQSLEIAKNHPGTWHLLPADARMAPVAQASWAFNTPVQMPCGGIEYLAIPATCPTALPRLLSAVAPAPDSAPPDAPAAVLAVRKVSTAAAKLLDFNGGSVHLMAVLLTTPNVVLQLPVLTNAHATLGQITSAGMMLLPQNDAALFPQSDEQVALWMLPVPNDAHTDLDVYSRPKHWAELGAVFADKTQPANSGCSLTWVRVQGTQVDVVIRGSVDWAALAHVVASAGGTLVDATIL